MAYVTVAHVTYLAEADQLRMRLAADGIDVFLPDEATLSLQPLWSNGIGSCRIQVREEDASRAAELLADLGVVEVRAAHACPRCGSADTEHEHVTRRFAFASLLLVGFPFLRRNHGRRCRACGHAWPL